MKAYEKVMNRLKGKQQQIELNNVTIVELQAKLSLAEVALNGALDNANVQDTIKIQRSVRDLEDEIQAIEIINQRLATAPVFTREDFEKYWNERVKEVNKDLVKQQSKLTKMKADMEAELKVYEATLEKYKTEVKDWEMLAFDGGIKTAEGNKFWQGVGLECFPLCDFMPEI